MVGLKHSTPKDIQQHHATLYKTFKARTCHPLAYRRSQLHQLARMAQDNADIFADAIATDLGKPRLEAFAFEVGAIVERSLKSAELLEGWMKSEVVENGPDWQKPWKPTVYKAPKGPSLIIAPWNYPMVLSLQPLIAAISAGCPAIVKPSELAPAYAQLLAELLPRYLDPQAYIVVNGGVQETTKLLELRWAHIFYTGNGRVGRIIATAAAKHLTPVSLELGGKSPVFVDSEYDMELAAKRILFGKCANAGQTCISPDYILVPQSKQAALVSALKARLAECYPEGPLSSPSFGRIVSHTHYVRLTGLLSRSKGVVVTGGLDEADESRLKLAPTVVADVQGDDSLMEEEIFGPILPIIPVEDVDGAIEFINSRDHPLAFYAFTDRQAIKQKLLDKTLSGSLIFNDTFQQLSINELPFSGVGESGYGYQVLGYGFDAFSHRRSSMDMPKEAEPHLAIRYAPYTPESFKFMSAAAYMPIPSPIETTQNGLL